MGELFVAFDPDQPAGQRLAPEVRAEVETIAPAVPLDGAITTPKLANGAVTHEKLADGAVHGAKVAEKAIQTTHLDDGVVGEQQIADGAVTPAKTAAGVFTVFDGDGNPLDLHGVVVTATEMAQIADPDPNAMYFVLDDDED